VRLPGRAIYDTGRNGPLGSFFEIETTDLRTFFFLYNQLARFWLLTMRPMLSRRLDSVSVECKSICLVQSQYSGDRYATAC
jgi:hypothetical protein